MNKKPNVGGQAVIEGVMMRGKTHVAVAVRQPDGEISVDVRPVNSISDRYPILKKPFLRGVVSLVESLVMGMKALAYSAQVSGDEDEKLDSKEMALTIAVSAGLAILLFIVIPTWSMRFLTGITQDHMALNLAEGVLRMAIFLAYIAAISSMNDIQRVFQYHGAEHKTIYTYEAGLPLKVENVRPFSTHDCHADKHVYFYFSGLAKPFGAYCFAYYFNACNCRRKLRAYPLCRCAYR